MKEIIAKLRKLSLVQIAVIFAIFLGFMAFFLLKEEEKVQPVVLQQPTEKGLELFDHNTWFKGEKELQVLEIRALKGQIEKDLLNFEKIKSASCILDIAPPRSLEKTKASVILTLNEGAFLNPSDRAAIALHVASGIKGLDPQKVVISDSLGRVYQGADLALIELEEKKAHLLSLLKKTIGQEHFVMMGQSCAIDSALASKTLKDELSKNFPEISFQYLPFRKKMEPVMKSSAQNTFHWFFLIPLALVGLAAFFLLKKRNKKSLDDITSDLKNQSPEKIAELLSYTRPERAKEVILSLPEEMQEKVFESMSELEKKL